MVIQSTVLDPGVHLNGSPRMIVLVQRTAPDKARLMDPGVAHGAVEPAAQSRIQHPGQVALHVAGVAVAHAHHQLHHRIAQVLVQRQIQVQDRSATALLSLDLDTVAGDPHPLLLGVPAPVELAATGTVGHEILVGLTVVQGEARHRVDHQGAFPQPRVQIAIDPAGSRGSPPGVQGHSVQFGAQTQIRLRAGEMHVQKDPPQYAAGVEPLEDPGGPPLQQTETASDPGYRGQIQVVHRQIQLSPAAPHLLAEQDVERFQGGAAPLAAKILQSDSPVPTGLIPAGNIGAHLFHRRQIGDAIQGQFGGAQVAPPVHQAVVDPVEPELQIQGHIHALAPAHPLRQPGVGDGTDGAVQVESAQAQVALAAELIGLGRIAPPLEDEGGGFGTTPLQRQCGGGTVESLAVLDADIPGEQACLGAGVELHIEGNAVDAQQTAVEQHAKQRLQIAAVAHPQGITAQAPVAETVLHQLDTDPVRFQGAPDHAAIGDAGQHVQLGRQAVDVNRPALAVPGPYHHVLGPEGGHHTLPQTVELTDAHLHPGALRQPGADPGLVAIDNRQHLPGDHHHNGVGNHQQSDQQPEVFEQAAHCRQHREFRPE